MGLDAVSPLAAGAYAPRPGSAPRPAGGPSFEDVLGRAADGLQLSKHAAKRLDRRDLDLDPARLDRLGSAIARAAEKGARNSVVMLDGLAVVVDVRQRTIVTAMNTQGGDQRVFTNIDSVVVA